MKKMNAMGIIRKPAIVFDLDGTLRRPASGSEFPQSTTDFELFDGVKEKINRLRKDNVFLLLVASNQGGVAHGHLTMADVDEGLEYTFLLMGDGKVDNQRGCYPFHIVKTCYHHPDGSIHPFDVESQLRKPNTGMLALMELECFEHGYAIDWPLSYFVGDRPEDKHCADNAGITFISADAFHLTSLDGLYDTFRED